MLLAFFGGFFQTSAGDDPEPVLRVPLAQQEAEGGSRSPFLKDGDESVKRLFLELSSAEVAAELFLRVSRGAPDTSTISQHMAKASSAKIVRAIRIPKAALAYKTPLVLHRHESH